MPEPARPIPDGGAGFKSDIASTGENPLVDSDAINRSLRSPEQRQRTFLAVLINTAVASLSTSYLWFGLTF